MKTNTASRIPLLPIPISIIDKYNHDPALRSGNKLLPISSNQRMNSYLKELACACGFNKELTFHCARHTFATTVTLTNGVPIESVSKVDHAKSNEHPATETAYAQKTASAELTFSSMVNIKGMTREQIDLATAILRMPTTLDDANDPFVFVFNRRTG